MRILVDGHNAMYALKISGRDHEARRKELLRRVADRAPDATVYFDARNAPPGGMDHARQQGVRVRYCRHREADHEILDDVRDADAPGRILVVTNDRELSGRATQLGAKSRRVQEFLRAAMSTDDDSGTERRWPRGRYEPSDFGLPDFVDPEAARHPDRAGMRFGFCGENFLCANHKARAMPMQTARKHYENTLKQALICA